MNRRQLTAVLIVIASAVEAPWARHATDVQLRAHQATRVCFFDEGPKDPSFVQFRSRLMTAIKSRSRSQLSEMISSDLHVIDLDTRGMAALDQAFDLRDPQSEFWGEMESVLNLGGRMEKPGFFCAPFLSCLGAATADAMYVVILGSDVPAFDQPNESSSIVARLSCDVLRSASGDGFPEPPGISTLGFTPVYLPSGRWAYVKESLTRSPAWYSAYFEKRRGKWLMVAFVAGD